MGVEFTSSHEELEQIKLADNIFRNNKLKIGWGYFQITFGIVFSLISLLHFSGITIVFEELSILMDNPSFLFGLVIICVLAIYSGISTLSTFYTSKEIVINLFKIIAGLFYSIAFLGMVVLVLFALIIIFAIYLLLTGQLF